MCNMDHIRTRPGRIDKKIKLDYLAPTEAIEMTEHFLGPMTQGQKVREPLQCNGQSALMAE